MRIKRIDNGKYYIVQKETLDPSNLKRLGFKNNKDEWIYRFPVKKYNKKVLLYAEVILIPSAKLFGVDVYDSDNKFYTPWYNVEFGNYEPFIKKIDNRISKELRKFKFYRFRRDNNAKKNG